MDCIDNYEERERERERGGGGEGKYECSVHVLYINTNLMIEVLLLISKKGLKSLERRAILCLPTTTKTSNWLA